MQCVLIVNTCLKTKVKLWIVDVNLSVHLSTYCQSYNGQYILKCNNKQVTTKAIIKITPKEIQIWHFKTVIPSISALRKITGGENTF